MKTRMILTIAAEIAAAGIAVADTVAWWHFDEAAPGTVAADGVIASGTVPEVYAKPYALTAHNPSTSGEYLPVHAKPFHGLSVYDPVSGNSRVNRSAMRFLTASEGGTNAYHGGCLIASTGAGQLGGCTRSITVEAFVCTTGGVFSTFAPIIGNLNGYAFQGENWAIYMMADGTLALRFNGNVWYSGDSEVGPAKIHDGGWHHVAFTWDGNVIKIYVDYEQDKLKSGRVREFGYNGTVSYGSDNSTRMGGYTGTANNVSAERRFNGLVDEVRISNVALVPDEFLRMRPVDMDADEILRISFEPGEYGVLNPGVNLADSLGPGCQRAVFKATGGSAGYDVGDKAGDVLGAGFSSVACANDASLRLMKDVSGDGGCYIQAEKFSDRFAGNSSTNYTIECFYKTSGAIRGAVSNRQSLFKIGADVWIANAMLCAQYPAGSGEMGDGSMVVSYRDLMLSDGAHWYDTTADKNLDDGCWHHLAIVVDGDDCEVRTYIDGRLSVRRTGYVPAPRLNENWAYSFFIGCDYGPKMFFDGWLDSVRVTLRALSPEEFMSANPAGSGDASLTALFEQGCGFACAENPAFSVTGGFETQAGGVGPAFEEKSIGTLLLGGAESSERTVNEWSISLNSGRVVFPPSPLFEADSCTIEFLAKFDGVTDAGDTAGDSSGSATRLSIMGLDRVDSSETEWRLYLRNDARNVIGLESGSSFAEWTLPSNSQTDGRWRHFALVLEPRTEDGASMAATLYLNGESLGLRTVSKQPRRVLGHRLTLGGADGASYVNGIFDVLRFTRGVLAPHGFIARLPRGLGVIIR